MGGPAGQVRGVAQCLLVAGGVTWDKYSDETSWFSEWFHDKVLSQESGHLEAMIAEIVGTLLSQ